MSQSKKTCKGHLTLAFNHIGNSDDIPARTLESLRNADLVVFESSKQGRQTLKAAGIHREFLLYSEHAENETSIEVKNHLKKGLSVVYCSDQGSPSLADPGNHLLKIAYQLHAQVHIIPGPSSISAAVAACPFVNEGYVFRGFPPRDKKDRILFFRSLSDELKALKLPVVLMDTPYRMLSTLEDALTAFPPEALAFLAYEISNPAELYLYQPLGKLSQSLAKTPLPKGNFVLILSW